MVRVRTDEVLVQKKDGTLPRGRFATLDVFDIKNGLSVL